MDVFFSFFRWGGRITRKPNIFANGQVNREHTAYGWNAQSGFDGGTVFFCFSVGKRLVVIQRDERYLKSPILSTLG